MYVQFTKMYNLQFKKLYTTKNHVQVVNEIFKLK